MKAKFKNLEHDTDPNNGIIVETAASLIRLLANLRSNVPFVAELQGDNGFQLIFGIGDDFGCVEYERIDGELPYLMAVSAQRPMKNGDVEFLMGGTATPISARFILSFDELQQIALHFLETGERSESVTWESI